MTPKACVLAAFLIMFWGALVVVVGRNEYRHGYIDAKSGVEAYRLVDQPDGSRAWVKAATTREAK